jgi:hypothetical protein
MSPQSEEYFLFSLMKISPMKMTPGSGMKKQTMKLVVSHLESL